jgi:methyltransferase (TIGR00027 family)
VLEHGQVFTDPLAAQILGRDAADIAKEEAAKPARRLMRLFIALRTRFAEDALAEAVAAGTRQLVILGAGLDTFAYRNPHAGLRVFEVDHPSTSAWKRARLTEVGLVPPPSLSFAPVDFERGSLADGLTTAGFEADRDAFFSWLGVVPYLTRDAIFDTLRFIASLRPATQMVFDYEEPPDALPAFQRAAHSAQAKWVASIGEPWLTYFRPAELARDLCAIGFSEIEDLGPSELAAYHFALVHGHVRQTGGHVVRIATPATEPHTGTALPDTA